MSLKDVLKLVGSLLVCQFAGIVGSFFTTPAISTWYASLERPSLAPPNWLFSPVWITLFILMGIALFLVWRKDPRDRDVRTGLFLFALQLVLNVLWSVLFFGLRMPWLAFFEILLLWLAILLTIRAFHKVSKTAAALLVPYVLWVSFAAVLNFLFWRLNP